MLNPAALILKQIQIFIFVLHKEYIQSNEAWDATRFLTDILKYNLDINTRNTVNDQILQEEHLYVKRPTSCTLHQRAFPILFQNKLLYSTHNIWFYIMFANCITVAL